MPEFIVTHGSIKTPGGIIEAGQPITLTDAEKKAMDPNGNGLMLKTLWDAKQKGKKAALAAEAEALAGVKPEPVKGGGK